MHYALNVCVLVSTCIQAFSLKEILRRSRSMPNSKLLWSFLGFQTLIILFFAFQINLLNTQIQSLSASTASADKNQATLASISDTRTIDYPDLYEASNSPTIMEIRAVIAEELQNIKPYKSIQANNSESTSTLTEPAPSKRIIEQMSEEVSDMIIALHGQHVVAPSDMASVELAIVKLPPTERREALNQLFKAVNNGQINTRF